MSCASNMKPKKMRNFLKNNTPLRHWRLIDNSDLNFRLMCHHIKKTKYLCLASNFANFNPHQVHHRRYKFPRRKYLTYESYVINEYNMHMGNVDLFDKMVQKYWRRTNYVSHGHALLSFFIHACIHQSFIASNHKFGFNYSQRNQLQYRIALLKRIKEEFTKKVKKEEIKQGRLKANLAPNERKTCSYTASRNKTVYYCGGCNNNFYCLMHMSDIHCQLMNKLINK